MTIVLAEMSWPDAAVWSVGLLCLTMIVLVCIARLRKDGTP